MGHVMVVLPKAKETIVMAGSMSTPQASSSVSISERMEMEGKKFNREKE
jgi:hypothetical protein